MKIALALAAVAMIVGPISLASTVSARDLSKEEKRIIENAVKDRLKDPDSAKFKWSPLPKGEPSVYCAEMNAKNSYGGYVGFTFFATDITLKGGKVVSASGYYDLTVGGMKQFDNRNALKKCQEGGYR